MADMTCPECGTNETRVVQISIKFKYIMAECYLCNGRFVCVDPAAWDELLKK